MATMERVRLSFTSFASVLMSMLPDGPDKTFILRELRTLAMWSNVTITRLPDGTPRDDQGDKTIDLATKRSHPVQE